MPTAQPRSYPVAVPIRKHHNLSVNDDVAAVASGSRATIDKCLNGLVLSYIQGLGLGLRSLLLPNSRVVWMTH